MNKPIDKDQLKNLDEIHKFFIMAVDKPDAVFQRFPKELDVFSMYELLHSKDEWPREEAYMLRVFNKLSNTLSRGKVAIFEMKEVNGVVEIITSECSRKAMKKWLRLEYQHCKAVN